jgi:hypothetical protein
MLSPATAFQLAYLPAERVTLTARHELVERSAATLDAKLKHAVEFSRGALKIEEAKARDADEKLAKLATAEGVALPAMPPLADVPAWLAALPDLARPHLTTPVLAAAWDAGEAARLVLISVGLAAQIAYLRCAAPTDATLRAEASDRARDLRDSAATLTRHLEATGLPLVIANAGSVAHMVSLTRNLEPTTTGGYAELNVLVRDLTSFVATKVRELNVAPPPPMTAPPTAAEEALLARIVAAPSDHALRLELAALAKVRDDPRADLIRLQLDADSDTARQRAHDLVRANPGWSVPLQQLGARDVKFAGGFPDEITIDADALLAAPRALLAVAPLTKLHVRAAKGKVAELVRAPFLATIETLDLDDQGVTDDDVVALAASPHAARLRQLDLRYNPLTARGVEAIAASPYLRRLEVVALDGNAADPVDQMEYYDETHQHAVPTEAGRALEAKYGRLPWLRRG